MGTRYGFIGRNWPLSISRTNFVQDVCCEEGNTLIALDQPTLVPNGSGMHPDAQSGAGRIPDRHD
jgi:predicted RNase H-like nuclease